MNSKAKENLLKAVNSSNLLGYFDDLHFRWQNEKEFEPWADYEELLKDALEQEVFGKGNLSNINGTQKPFGIQFEYEGSRLYIELKQDGGYIKLVGGVINTLLMEQSEQLN